MVTDPFQGVKSFILKLVKEHRRLTGQSGWAAFFIGHLIKIGLTVGGRELLRYSSLM